MPTLSGLRSVERGRLSVILIWSAIIFCCLTQYKWIIYRSKALDKRYLFSNLMDQVRSLFKKATSRYVKKYFFHLSTCNLLTGDQTWSIKLGKRLGSSRAFESYKIYSNLIKLIKVIVDQNRPLRLFSHPGPSLFTISQ